MMLVLAAGVWHAAGQTAVDLSRQGKLGTGTTLPVRCTVGQVFFMTNASAGANLYACTAPNVWSAMGLPALGGDASGTQQSITVTGIQGRGVSTASPADQNVLRWNATTGKWEPGFVPVIGAAPPPGNCAAGSLYLLNDTTNHIQQLYVCSSTNTWTIASIGSGPAANRPANCVAGQTWLSTDTAVMTYCAATGNPGTWSALAGAQGPAGPAGPQGPVGANGNTILNGAGAPSASIGVNGDFYLNTAANCFYGPKASGAWPTGCTSLVGGSPNFTATAGNASMSTATGATGITQTFLDPGQTPLPYTGNIQVPIGIQTYASGYNNPGPYGNIQGELNQLEVFNGWNSSYTDFNKDSISTHDWAGIFNASGQRTGYGTTLFCFGTGDCTTDSSIIYYTNRVTAPGDEGIAGAYRTLYQNPNLMKSTAGTITKSNCGITGLAAGTYIANSSSSIDTRIVTVVGPTTNCNVGDWLDIDNGVFGVNAAGPTGDAYHEPIQIIAKTGSTITALFHEPHCGTSGSPCGSPVPVAASPIIGISPPLPQAQWGQDAIIVDLDGASYSTGTAACDSPSGTTITGAGTSWSTAMVGGDANFVGVISFPGQNFSSDVFSGGAGPLVSWYPISSVTSGTHLTLALVCAQSQLNDTSLTVQQPYIIRWGGYTSALTVAYGTSYGTNTEGVNGLVMRSTSGASAWTAGHHIENILSPNSSVSRGYYVNWTHFGPVPYGKGPDMYTAINRGYAQAASLLKSSVSSNESPTFAGYYQGIDLAASTEGSQISVGGQSLEGQGISLTTFGTGRTNGYTWMQGTGDPKAITWAGTGWDGAILQPMPAGGGFAIASHTPKLVLGNWSNSWSSLTLDASGTTANRTLTVPDASGTIFVPQGGTFTRTTPASTTQTVDIGTASTGFSYLVDAWICGGNNGQCDRYLISAPYYATSGNWAIISPITRAVQPTLSPQWQLEGSQGGDGILRLRLRSLDGSAVTATVTLVIEGSTSNVFTPDSTVATTTAPTAAWPGTVITQLGNKLLLTNASNVVATVDPTGITANRTLTVPDLSGTFALSNFPAGSGSAPSLTTTSCSGAAIGAGSTNWAGVITGLPAGSCTMVLTFASATAAHDWSCQFSNRVTPANLFVQSNSSASTTTATVSGTSASGDALRYTCVAF